MAERQIEHRKSCLVLSARFPVVNWRTRPVAKSALYTSGASPYRPLKEVSPGVNILIIKETTYLTVCFSFRMRRTVVTGCSFLAQEYRRMLIIQGLAAKFYRINPLYTAVSWAKFHRDTNKGQQRGIKTKTLRGCLSHKTFQGLSLPGK